MALIICVGGRQHKYLRCVWDTNYASFIRAVVITSLIIILCSNTCHFRSIYIKICYCTSTFGIKFATCCTVLKSIFVNFVNCKNKVPHFHTIFSLSALNLILHISFSGVKIIVSCICPHMRMTQYILITKIY